MESLKRSIRYQLMESKSFILGFWTTTLIINIFFYVLNNLEVVNFSIGFSLGSSQVTPGVSVAGINLMIIFISLIVYNYERNYESFPLAISLSMSRKNYFLSFLIDNLLISFIFAMIQGILLKIDPFFIKLIGGIPLYDFLYFNTKTDNLFYIVFILFISFLAFISLWSLISSINYKFGYKMWLTFLAFNILVSILNLDSISKIFEPISQSFEFRLGSYQILFLIISIIAFSILNYFIVIRTNIKKKIS